MKCLVVLALIVLVAMVTTEASVCELPLETGFCRGYFPSWGFSNGECKEFVYGGCGGNDNRFQTKQECADACE